MRWACPLLLLLFGSLLQAQSNDAVITQLHVNAKWGAPNSDHPVISVEMRYEFEGLADDTLALKSLNVQDHHILFLHYNWTDIDNEYKPATLEGKGKVHNGAIPIEPQVSSDKMHLRMRYIITNFQDLKAFDLNIPIVYPENVKGQTGEGLFTAHVELPADIQVSEYFPVQRWITEPGPKTSKHKLSLQAIPSVINIKGSTEPKSMRGTLLWVDLGVMIVLAGLLFLGWKKIKAV